MTFLGPYLAACALLVLAGAAKVRAPGDTAKALRVSPSLVRAGAAVEVAIGAAGLASTVAAPLVALSYAAFAGYVVVLLRRDAPLATCGCFGRPDTPATRVHVALDAAFALAAVSVIGSSESIVGAGVTLVFAAAVITGLALVALSALPAVIAVRRELAS